jgi:HEAT repeat protein
MTVPTLGEWAQFRDAVFGDPYTVWHDGPDFTKVLALGRTKPDTVARMLRTGVEAGDALAAQSIAALGHAGLPPAGALAVLEAAAQDATGTFAVRVAQALRALTGDESSAAAVVDVLTTDPRWTDRIDAAIALGEFAPSPELLDALVRGVQDPEYLVRYHSANSLLRFAGQPPEIAEHRELFAKITEPGAGDAWLDAARELSSAVNV